MTKRSFSYVAGAVAGLYLIACGSDAGDAAFVDESSVLPDHASSSADTAGPAVGANTAAAPVMPAAERAASGSAGRSAAPLPTTPSTGAPPTSTPSPGAPASGTSGAAGSSAAAGPSITPTVPAPTNTERLSDVGTQPFQLVAHDPFSTFAADVDTASYDIFRRNLEHNVAPVATAVRVEEFVNYFSYEDPRPADDAEHPFQISTALTENPLGRDTRLLRVAIAAKNPAVAEKKPAHLVFLVDTSGSMQSEDKLPLVQYLLTRTLDVLDADDKISIVTYAGTTEVRLPPTSIVEKDAIIAVINGLSASGSTAGASGIQLAYEQAETARVEDGINHVILCTDGDFNVGISDTNALVDLIEEKRTSGITLTALGFGIGNLNDAMMEKVSNAGNGMYSVITTQTQASRYAEDRMLSTFVHVAKDMKIQLEWNPNFVEAFRLIGYEDRALTTDQFRDDAVDAGEIGAGHRVTALYEIVPKGGDIPDAEGAPEPRDGTAVDGEREIGAEDLVLVKVRYKQPGAAESDAASEVVSTLAGSELADASPFADASRDVRWTVAIAGFAEVVKQSPFAAPDKLNELGLVFDEQKDRDVERGEFYELFGKARNFLPSP